MRILLVEDEKRLAAALLQLFKEHNYAADVAYDGMTGWDLASTNSYDILILDVMLPEMNGLEIVRQVRAQKLDVPILLLTARDAVSDRVAGLDAGADDYLVKPFANEELLARIRALARRPAALVGTDAIAAGPFRIDLASREATRNGQPLNLTAKEFQLLELFIRNHGKVLAKDLILDRVWGPDADVIANAVENYVHFLRKKIDQPGQPSYIETVRGVGYVFKIPE
ncbi:response regulator transcription factor [Alicyclobacillus kakegawensis]|uniref:response regulator transcription factor n=1 Tax=Alicyclobacillus kakegawensis TaxID=392012 RepID=UPI0008329627|nr:response regulator transcription factor [Alicyclobacillus kakegawensis]